MTELLIFLLVAAAYALGRARDERDRLLRLLAERRVGRPMARPHWQPIDAQLEAERQVWQQAAAFERAARQAMHRVVDTSLRPVSAAASPAPSPSSPVRGSLTRRARPETAVRSSGLSADDVKRVVEEQHR